MLPLQRVAMKVMPANFDGQCIRRVFDEATGTWWFSVIDVVQVLTQQPGNPTARSLHMADALIAATAMTHSLPLLTFNGQHFPAVVELKVQVFKP